MSINNEVGNDIYSVSNDVKVPEAEAFPAQTVCFYTRCAWAGGTCANYPDFFENISFMFYLLCYSRICTFFEEFLIHNSHCRFMILKNN
jgi:hypothetical protein